jgi:hypothetical protein
MPHASVTGAGALRMCGDVPQRQDKPNIGASRMGLTCNRCGGLGISN